MAASPIVAWLVLRLRVMSPVGLPDPSMHTTYIIDPQDIIRRYSAVFAPTARLREAARVGFLVPARLTYLAFGAVPGFLVLRYLLALVAVVPTYLLLRRLYGRGAGALAAVVILSSPVVITAWGTDFPDAAVVSYLIGGLACLAMPATTNRVRTAWLAGAATLLTMAVWALFTSAPIVAVTLVVYVLIRLTRDRRGLIGNVVMLGAVAAFVTVGLGAASYFLIGQFDYVTPTIKSLMVLSAPGQEAVWHSTNWRWAPYDAYLLVPPAVVVAWLVAFARSWRTVAAPQLFVGLALVGQLALLVYLQFFNRVQVLELHYFSSALWAAVCVTLAVTLCELTKPLLRQPGLQFAPALLVVGVALLYEALPGVPAFAWLPVGAVVAGVIVAAAALGRAVATHASRMTSWVGGGIAVVVLTAAALVLTVAPEPPHAHVADTGIQGVVPPAYGSALGGGGDGFLVDQYRVVAQIPAFAGDATYRGEQLLTCWSPPDLGAMVAAMGIFHNGFNSIGFCESVGPAALRTIEGRRAAQLLTLSVVPISVSHLLRALRPLHPVLVRSAVLRSGSYALHVSLIDIRRYLQPSKS